MKIDGVYVVSDKRFKKGWRYTDAGRKRHKKRVGVTIFYITGFIALTSTTAYPVAFGLILIVMMLYPIIKIQHKAKELDTGYSPYELKVRKPLNADIKKQVWSRDRGRCKHCDISDSNAVMKTGQHLHYDHIIPFSLGGPDTVNNIQLLCSTCNTSKGARSIG